MNTKLTWTKRTTLFQTELLAVPVRHKHASLSVKWSLLIRLSPAAQRSEVGTDLDLHVRETDAVLNELEFVFADGRMICGRLRDQKKPEDVPHDGESTCGVQTQLAFTERIPTNCTTSLHQWHGPVQLGAAKQASKQQARTSVGHSKRCMGNENCAVVL